MGGANGSVERSWEDAMVWEDTTRDTMRQYKSRVPIWAGMTPSMGHASRGLVSAESFANRLQQTAVRKRVQMQTGCIPCLIKRIPCDPKNPGCKLAISDDWMVNASGTAAETAGDGTLHIPAASESLTILRPDTKWRRSWRERHSLNFFVNFSAPQMAGFFDSGFWSRSVIQATYHEPAILHAVTAIGSLHECIMQRAFQDERRKAQAMEFALKQCNRAISCLTGENLDDDTESLSRRRKLPTSKVALMTCVLFTCFEAMQGRCDSAVNHAIQGRRLLLAAGAPSATAAVPDGDEIEQMRPLVDRLEVQATALMEKGKRPEVDSSHDAPELPHVDAIYSLDHAHMTLHSAMNSVMRFMQGFQPTAPRDHIAISMAEKHLRYAPWFSRWEASFTAFLSVERPFMTNMDLKRAMVLKANHLVATMLASVDQSAGPAAYDLYEQEFRAIVDLAREVLATFSCPPLPTLSPGQSGTPYLSFSLWVTDPLWMAISRCRNPSIRQAAFTLLSQNPRQEGIWHAGPQTSPQFMRRVEAGPSVLRETVKGNNPPKEMPHNGSSSSRTPSFADNGHSSSHTISPESGNTSHESQRSAPRSSDRARQEWVDLKAQIQEWAGGSSDEASSISESKEHQRVPGRYKSYCTGRCTIPSRDESSLAGYESERSRQVHLEHLSKDHNSVSHTLGHAVGTPNPLTGSQHESAIDQHTRSKAIKKRRMPAIKKRSHDARECTKKGSDGPDGTWSWEKMQKEGPEWLRSRNDIAPIDF